MEVALVMGSITDWPMVKNAAKTLDQLGISYSKNVISAHRMPKQLQAFGQKAKAKHYQVIIAGAGGAAHLPGMMAANTTLPVIGIPAQTKALGGMDSLLSIVQMPTGIPVGTVAIGSAGAKNAAILAAEIVALHNDTVNQKLINYRKTMTKEAIKSNDQLN